MITRATLSDVTELSLLINSAYRGETSKKGWTTEAHLLEGSRTSAEELEQIILAPNQYLFKYIQDEKIIGSVLLIAQKEALYLGMLTVAPDLQNGGIGKQLLKTAEEQARILDLNKIQMTVIGVRKELLAWYIRNGYLETGAREPFPFGEKDKALTDSTLDFIVLEKKLIF
ncbi:MAG: GNAT family N-acetyltransferase [Flavobacterium sp.]